MDFGVRSVDPGGSVIQAFRVRALDLDEAYRLARCFAAVLVAGNPEGKGWAGWCIDVLDGSGRHQISLPMVGAR